MKTNLKTKIGFGIGSLIIMIITLFFVLSQNITGQKKGDPAKSDKNQPKVDIKVNKQVDKNGNITQYDSTYTWAWSGNGEIPADIDSIFKSMQSNFNYSIFNDSLFFSMPFGLNHFQLSDSTWDLGHFRNFFDEDFGNLDKFMEQHNKLIEKYFHRKPYLKIPENKKDKTSDIQDSKKQKKENSIKTEKISGKSVSI